MSSKKCLDYSKSKSNINYSKWKKAAKNLHKLQSMSIKLDREYHLRKKKENSIILILLCIDLVSLLSCKKEIV